jgi:uncharacterized protein (TIGR03663 family)
MNGWVGLGWLFIIGGALALRSPQLGLRPMHNDEAVNAIKLRDLWQEGRYRYDPDEHHGPTLYYATLPFVWLSGAQDFTQLSERTLRAVSVFFGLLLIVLIALVADGCGLKASLAAAALMAISPAMVFYSRYYIHEMLLICFTMLVIGAGWRYTVCPGPGWSILAGVGLGLMYATKETFIIPAGAMLGAVGLTVAWDKSQGERGGIGSWRWPHVGLGLAAAGVVALLLFTSFLTNASGPLDSIKTYLPWLKRAGGASPHIHPWYFYLERLAFFKERRGSFWSEGLIILLAVVGAIGAFRRGHLPDQTSRFARFLTFYTVLVTAAYSSIAYKTPWCLLGFLHGMILLGGIGVVVLAQMWASRRLQALTLFAVAIGAGQLAWQSVRASYADAADPRNPYVYAQTSPNLLQLVDKVKELARFHQDGSNVLVKVIVPDSDYWPLPWYLRSFRHVGWWERMPADPYAPIMIVGAAMRAALDEKSDKRWLMVGYFELRPKTFLELYVEFPLWQRYVQSLPRNAGE